MRWAVSVVAKNAAADTVSHVVFFVAGSCAEIAERNAIKVGLGLFKPADGWSGHNAVLISETEDNRDPDTEEYYIKDARHGFAFPEASDET